MDVRESVKKKLKSGATKWTREEVEFLDNNTRDDIKCECGGKMKLIWRDLVTGEELKNFKGNE